MILVETVAALIVILIVISSVVVPIVLIKRLRHRRTIEGRIEAKRLELLKQEGYIQGLYDNSGPAYRKQMLESYKSLAQKKRDRIAFELAALEIEKDREEFEKNMRSDA